MKKLDRPQCIHSLLVNSLIKNNNNKKTQKQQQQQTNSVINIVYIDK